jgi:mRNA-degrading endonuclease RelE of RelBE toxin-antitoxin system
MDKITKFLKRLTKKERERVMQAMVDIIADELAGYDQKKMKGHANVYRVRVGDIRIVYLELNNKRRILLVTRRDDTTYRDF